MKEKGTNSVAGPELLVELRRTARTPLRAQLENGLREAVRSGRLSARARPPRTRALSSPIRTRPASGNASARTRPRRLASAGGGRLRTAPRRGLSRRAPGSRHVRGRRSRRDGRADRRARVAGAPVRLL